jgi:hypothetical protein
VYRLELVQSGVGNSGGRGAWAQFSIKLYPYRHHPIFGRFSPREQSLMQSGWFDHTHTPTFEAQDRIAPDLFTVAGLTVEADASGRLTHFCFESMEPLRTVDRSRGSPPGDVVRNLSGIEAGFPLFDTLVCLHSFTGRRSPARVRAVHTPGFEFHVKNGEVSCRPSSSVRGCRVSVRYPGTEDEKDRAGRLPTGEPALEEQESLVFDSDHGCRHLCPSLDGRHPKIPINEKWWAIAGAHHRSHLASACGCSMESHGE